MKALFDTCNGQGGFKTFAKTPACLQHTDAYDMISNAHLFHYYSHPFALMFECLLNLTLVKLNKLLEFRTRC